MPIRFRNSTIEGELVVDLGNSPSVGLRLWTGFCVKGNGELVISVPEGGSALDFPASGTIATTAGVTAAVAAGVAGVTWSTLSGKPVLFSGAYADLTGKPTIPIISNTTVPVAFGTVSLGSKDITVTVPGALTTDVLTAQPLVALPANLELAHARISAADTVVLTVGTSIALGLDLGATTYNLQFSLFR